MVYELMGWLHASLMRASDRIEGQRGQGTVEYVGLILLLAVLLAGVVMALKGTKGSGIGDTIVKKLKEAIGHPKIG